MPPGCGRVVITQRPIGFTTSRVTPPIASFRPTRRCSFGPSTTTLIRKRRMSQSRTLAALTIVSKGHYSDTYAQTRRSQPMALQAEMVWAFLAPRTFATATTPPISILSL